MSNLCVKLCALWRSAFLDRIRLSPEPIGITVQCRAFAIRDELSHKWRNFLPLVCRDQLAQRYHRPFVASKVEAAANLLQRLLVGLATGENRAIRFAPAVRFLPALLVHRRFASPSFLRPIRSILRMIERNFDGPNSRSTNARNNSTRYLFSF